MGSKLHICSTGVWNKGITGYSTSKKGKKYPDYIPWNKDIKLSEEQKNKLNLSGLEKGRGWNKGKTNYLSKETRKKMGEAKRGIKLSEERKKQMSVVRMGHPSYTKGMKFSEETKFKMRKSAKRGEQNHNWKGGITKTSAKIRNSFKYRQWRSDIFTRDDFVCQICGVRGGKLNVDHIKTFATIISENNIISFEQGMVCEELWNINNGRTLCFECHKKTETFLNRWKSGSFLLQTQPNMQPTSPVVGGANGGLAG